MEEQTEEREAMGLLLAVSVTGVMIQNSELQQRSATMLGLGGGTGPLCILDGPDC